MTIAEIMHHTLAVACIEPEKRVKCLHHVPRGRRNLPESPRYIRHRFRIKGGITGARLVAENITSNNALLKRLRERA